MAGFKITDEGLIEESKIVKGESPTWTDVVLGTMTRDPVNGDTLASMTVLLRKAAVCTRTGNVLTYTITVAKGELIGTVTAKAIVNANNVTRCIEVFEGAELSALRGGIFQISYGRTRPDGA